MTETYNKLVRDKIPEIIRESGKTPVTKQADKAEMSGLLKEKLMEEVQEFVETDNIEEVADILEVIKAIAKNKGVDWQEVEKMRMEKEQDRGGFEHRIVLLHVK